MEREEVFCVIMAGGIGSRFWPKSTTAKPKQFLDFLGTGRSLIQQTFDRFKDIVPSDNFYVVTNEIYKAQVLNQLPELREEQVLCEPAMRNTAPCIAYANWAIKKRSSNAVMVVTPADHLILKENAFHSVISKAIEEASNTESLITLGIKPSRPDTGYGYIEVEKENKAEIKKVVSFREKPNLEKAQEFLQEGNYSWNSGMFIWSIDSISKGFVQHLPEIDERFSKGAEKFGTQEESGFINEIYPNCESISIDYGIMEKAENVYVLEADIGWSDLGTWGSVYNHLEADTEGNAVVGNKVLLNETKNCLINTSNDKVVVVDGLDNYIIVDTESKLLIIKKENEQAIKQFRSRIEKEIGKDFV